MSMNEYIRRVGRYIFKGVPVNNIHVNVTIGPPSNKLADKVVLVTGGGSGIGFAIAKKCIESGARVFITGRNINKLKDASLELGERCRYAAFDVTDINTHRELIYNAEAAFSMKVNCLVSNAGISLHEGNFYNVNEVGWDKQFDTDM